MEPYSVYLAGPMRGQPLYNFRAFAEAALWLRGQGFIVYNPAERDLACGFQPHLPLDHGDQVFSMEEAFSWDFWAITRARGIVLLPGWEASEGAKKELVLAQGLGKDIHQYSPGSELLPINPTVKVEAIL